MRTADEACHLLRHARNADRESFYVLAVDNQNQVQGVEEVARGSLGDVAVHPREVFKVATLLNAAAVVVAHNHPSGAAAPSQPDIEMTKRLVAAGKLLGIPVLDHLVIGRTSCSSIADVDPTALRGPRRYIVKRKRRR